MKTEPAPENWVIQQQGPGEPIFILGPAPLNCFLAKMEEGTVMDARLMAAAPELLAALKAALPYVEQRADSLTPFMQKYSTDPDLEKIRGAIAKATTP